MEYNPANGRSGNTPNRPIYVTVEIGSLEELRASPGGPTWLFNLLGIALALLKHLLFCLCTEPNGVGKFLFYNSALFKDLGGKDI